MDLKTIHIAGYKDLADARLTFETGESPITIIGNNSTGKSSLIEALLHIFVGFYYGKPLNSIFTFSTRRIIRPLLYRTTLSQVTTR